MERSNVLHQEGTAVLKSNSTRHALRFMVPFSQSDKLVPAASQPAESSPKHGKQSGRLKKQKNYSNYSNLVSHMYIHVTRGRNVLPSSTLCVLLLLLFLLLLLVVLHQCAAYWLLDVTPDSQQYINSKQRFKGVEADSTTRGMVQLILPDRVVNPLQQSLQEQLSHDSDSDYALGGLTNETVAHSGRILPWNHLNRESASGNNYSMIRSKNSKSKSKMRSINPGLGLSNPMKIFVYNLPSRFNEDWLKQNVKSRRKKKKAEEEKDGVNHLHGDQDEDGDGASGYGGNRCSNHLFAAEVAIHKRLMSESCASIRTTRPWEANLFFVPVYVSCNFNTSTGLPSLGHARALLHSAVSLVSQQMPYWNRSRGKDHVFVATHDYGACFHTMEDRAVAAGIPRFLRNSIILQTFGQIGGHPCQPSGRNYIQIPPFVPPMSALDLEAWRPEAQVRDIWAYFRGKIELHPKNISGRIYGRGVRSAIWRRYARDRRFVIKRRASRAYRDEMRRSVFCLCPRGWAPWSPRIVESVLYGCVPVIVADGAELPLSHSVEWAGVSLRVPERDVRQLGRVLTRVARTNLSAIQARLWSPRLRRALLYLDPLQSGDATWHALDSLSTRLS